MENRLKSLRKATMIASMMLMLAFALFIIAVFFTEELQKTFLGLSAFCALISLMFMSISLLTAVEIFEKK